MNVMPSQSQPDFVRMQREAEQRVMEMQRRARQRVEDPPPAPPPPPPPAPPASPPQKHGFLDMLNIKSLLEGKDTSLVLMVMAMLGSENADPLLMLALLYVMM